MKDSTKGGLMLVFLFSFFLFLICLGVNSFLPAFVVFVVIFVIYCLLKSGVLIDSED